MTRAEVTAYFVFAIIVCFLFMKTSRHTSEYGERLRRMRIIAKSSLHDWSDDDTDDDPSVRRMLIHLKDNSVVGHTGNEENMEELLRVTKKMAPNSMILEHLPDSTNTSNIVAIYRIDSETHSCVTYTNT